jgi:hypothetical protein
MHVIVFLFTENTFLEKEEGEVTGCITSFTSSNVNISIHRTYQRLNYNIKYRSMNQNILINQDGKRQVNLPKYQVGLTLAYQKVGLCLFDEWNHLYENTLLVISN